MLKKGWEGGIFGIYEPYPVTSVVLGGPPREVLQAFKYSMDGGVFCPVAGGVSPQSSNS